MWNVGLAETRAARRTCLPPLERASLKTNSSSSWISSTWERLTILLLARSPLGPKPKPTPGCFTLHSESGVALLWSSFLATNTQKQHVLLDYLFSWRKNYLKMSMASTFREQNNIRDHKSLLTKANRLPEGTRETNQGKVIEQQTFHSFRTSPRGTFSSANDGTGDAVLSSWPMTRLIKTRVHPKQLSSLPCHVFYISVLLS